MLLYFTQGKLKAPDGIDAILLEEKSIQKSDGNFKISTGTLVKAFDWEPKTLNSTKGLTPMVGNALSIELISVSLEP